MAYNPDLATALSMAPQLGTLSTTTQLTSTAGAVIWNRCYDEVRAAWAAAGIDPTPASFTSGSVAEGLADSAEMLLTSGRVLLAKGSIGKDAKSTAMDLIAEAREIMGRWMLDRPLLLAQGATALGGAANPFVKSHQVDDKDPDFDFAPGTGDRQYAVNDVYPQDGDPL